MFSLNVTSETVSSCGMLLIPGSATDTVDVTVLQMNTFKFLNSLHDPENFWK